jgi:lysozyme family protein
MVDLVALTQRNAARWSSMRVTRDASAVAARLCAPAARTRYRGIAQKTGVPWFVIAVVHEREASQSWMANLAQGDPWNAVSIHQPAGRGPFASFEKAAIDALVNCPPYAARWIDWSAGGTLTLLERYNGIGYAARNVPSPYVWAGTDQYVRGKFTADHVYDPDAVDRQFGCACLLRAMMVLDPTITFTGVTITPKPPDRPAPAPASSKPSRWTAFLSAILSIFKRTS